MGRGNLLRIAAGAWLTAALTTIAAASPEAAPECKALRWSGASERELVQMQFGEIPRDKLVQIAWGESLAEPEQSVAGLALYYLFATESHLPLKTYYQDLANKLGAGKFTMRGLAARYPIRKGNSKITESLADLCGGFAAALKLPNKNYITNYGGGPVR